MAGGSDIVTTRPAGPLDRPAAAPAAPALPLGLVAVAIFILALAPRLAGLEQHLTADDQDWMRRASSFAVSVQRDNPRGTYQSAHPGVPVLWLATLAIGPERAEALARAGTLAELEKSSHYLPALFDVRRALAVASALLTAVAALLAWRLFGPLAGLLAGLLLAFEPFLVAHGRLFHTDPLLALLMAASVLAAMAALGAAPTLPYMVLSGALAGLAFLTKAPGVFLFGFVPLLALTTTWRRTRRVGLTEVRRLVLLLAPWGLAALVAYVLLWPALWVEPLRTLERMVDAVRGVGESPRRWGNFFLGQAVPEDVGPLFYPVATVLRLSPVTMVGLGLLAAIGLRRRAEGVSDKGREARTDGGWAASGTLALLDFVVLFTAMMTLSDKKLDRYLLPVYPVLVIMAAVGFAAAIQRWLPPSVPPSLRPSVPPSLAAAAALGIIQALLVLGVHPYPLSFFNPLLGGIQTAHRVMIVGWGEGTDQVARYFGREADAERVVVTSLYHDLIHPMFRGTGLPPWEWQRAEYFVDYVNMEQRQIGEPLRRELQRNAPIFTVRINGLEYAKVYRIPPELKARRDLSEGLRGATVPKP